MPSETQPAETLPPGPEAALSGRGTRSRNPPVNPGTSGPARLLMKQTALALFQEHGFRNVSVRDITGSLGLTPAAVYAHFRSKEHLLHELLLDGHAEIHRLLRVAADAAGEDPVAALIAHTYLLGIFHTEMQDLARIGPDVRYLPEREREQILDERRSVRATFEAIVTRGRDAGVFDVVHVRLTTALVLNMTRSISNFYRADGKADGRLDHRTLAAHNCRLALRAVSGTDPGLHHDLHQELLSRLDTAIREPRDVLSRTGPV